jgi:SAM-dependent methyltransferase
MVKKAADHYADHLGPIYTWMIGDVDAALSRSGAELDSLPLPSKTGAIAVDLGAGFGMHAIPLAQRGFSVVAIDTCEILLKDLEARAGLLAVRTVQADLLDFPAHIGAQADVIACMGDTLTHLPDQSSVAALFAAVAASLAPGGLFVATFRDYASAPLLGESRFISVRSDERRILTCFLEYREADVIVHDLLQQRDGASWRLRVSSYPKLRLAPQWAVDRLNAHGLTAVRDTAPGGMIRVTARMPLGRLSDRRSIT